MAKNLFNSVKMTKPQKNVFDLTHDVKLSANMGDLTPILTLECVPGDKFDLSCESMIRFAPLTAPVMHRMDVTMHYFFVPNRILWDNWEKYITDANSGLVRPYLSSEEFEARYAANNGTCRQTMDYLGVPPPPNSSTNTQLTAFPFAAYQSIYNEYYRDQNLVVPVNYKLNDGDNYTSWARFRELTTLRKRAWEHDYFTASLPFAQKGPAVDIPLGSIQDDADIHIQPNTATTLTGTPINVDLSISANNATTDIFAKTTGLQVEPTTINELRRAFRLQEWLEKNARGGTRYIENILAHFGVKSSDARLQRPEYITGVKSPVVVSEVLQTGQSDSTPQGNMAGHGISVSSGRTGSYYCEEHGYIIGIMSVMPKTAYQQGIPRTFLKNDSLDYFWPSFAHIGEQEVQLQELYAYTANNQDTFGYVPRYAEYKYMPSRVAGDFRNTLDYWHLGRIFANEPALNEEFITCTSDDTSRIFAVEDPDAQKLYCHVLNKIKAVRPMPKYGTPTF
ncbi:MAG: major capsid protein [Limnohabitans sp.]|nr:major capsid protein [Limnohabitans sp.]